MKRRIRWGRVLVALAGGALVLLLLVVALAALRGALTHYPRYTPSDGLPEVSLGAFHVHSTASDGLGTREEIAAAAARAGLSFVILTDHNIVPAPPLWVDGVLMISGVEVSTRDGHLVVLGGAAPERGTSGADAIRSALESEVGESFVVLAHPVQRKNPWRAWEAARGVQGFELYSADTFFRDALGAPLTRLLPAIGGWLGDGVHGTLLLATPQEAPMARLLEHGREAGAVALCSHDAHGYPPYEDVFRALSLQISERLDLNPAVAAEQVLDQVRTGSALCVFRGLGSGAEFQLEGLSSARTIGSGKTLRVFHPALSREDVEVRVFGDGSLEADGRTVRAGQAGLIQVELWMRAPGRLIGEEWRPWIVPSPVRVLSP